ncbi:M42 family metallopeptidase [SAR202 cluster bacterium AC-647-N09_OGT_505m]|nr:M42 family metallopeptidase [SAR202 cluster bacterium AC-647-N09_OGT_505m]
MDNIESLLEELTNAHGPSGFESPVRSIMQREFSQLCHHIETDGIGSLMARLSEDDRGPRIMMAAHMDELGLMVKFVTAEGYVRFLPLGGWLDQALINQRWVILTRTGPVPGITGIKTVHVMTPEARSQLFKREQMFIDVGASSLEDAEERLGIRPGDPISPDSKFTPLSGGSLYLAKAWDDRVGLGVMIEVMRRLQNAPPPNTLYAVATVQEEIGLRGAHTSSYQIGPDIGINIEAGVAGDYPGISPEESQERVGKGPAIFLHDTSMLPNLKLRDLFIDVAKENGIPVQFDVLSGYGEDGAEMQRSGGGAPTINIAVPTRYLHSHYGIISRQDFDSTADLVTAVIQRLDAATIQHMKSFD